jgi:hypothetical protein
MPSLFSIPEAYLKKSTFLKTRKTNFLKSMETKAGLKTSKEKKLFPRPRKKSF